jgi:hypothetical protein
MAHFFVPCTQEITADETAKSFLQGVYRLHGLPCVLISDPRFVSAFWHALRRRLGTKLNMFSSRHPKTNNVTERINSTFQQLLRVFNYYDGSDWVTWLPQVEFAYNASRALGIEHTPFEGIYGFSHEEPPDLLLPIRPSIPISEAAHERLQHLSEVHQLFSLCYEFTKMTCRLLLIRQQYPSYSHETRFRLLHKASFYTVNSIESLRTTSWDFLQYSRRLERTLTFRTLRGIAHPQL